MKSETDKAREVRREVIRVYGHYLEGQLTYIREPEWEILKNDLEILAAERSDLLKKLENVNRRVAAKVDRLTDLKMKVDSVLEYVQTGSYNESVFVTSVYGDTTLHAPSKEPKLN
jgi:chromosome segregation ATPase